MKMDPRQDHMVPFGLIIHTGWIPQALGSLWDASRALKPSGKSKNRGFPCFSIFSSLYVQACPL